MIQQFYLSSNQEKDLLGKIIIALVEGDSSVVEDDSEHLGVEKANVQHSLEKEQANLIDNPVSTSMEHSCKLIPDIDIGVGLCRIYEEDHAYC